MCEEKMRLGTRLRETDIVSIFMIRVLVFIEAMNMLSNPQVFRTLAEYKKGSLASTTPEEGQRKARIRNFLGAQSLLGLQGAYNQLMKDGRHIA